MTGFNFIALPAATHADAIRALRTMLAGNPPAMIDAECEKTALEQATSVTNRVYQFRDGSRLDARGWIR